MSSDPPLWEFTDPRPIRFGNPMRAELTDDGASPAGWHWVRLDLDDNDECSASIVLDPAAAEGLELALREFRERRQ